MQLFTHATPFRVVVRAALAMSLLVPQIGTVSPLGARVAEASPGQRLQTVDLTGTAAECSGTQEIGTSVGLVPGSLIADASGQSLARYPVLLVTSCFGPASQGGGKINFLAPPAPYTSFGAAPLPVTPIIVRTITTSFVPGEGWGAVAPRPDKADLLACGSEDNGTHSIYSIKINFNASGTDGTTTKLFDAQPGATICDGVAWDAGTKTIYQSPDVAGVSTLPGTSTLTTINEYTQTGTLIRSFAPPAGCLPSGGSQGGNSGLAVSGPNLFISCDGKELIFQVDKNNPANVVRTIDATGLPDSLRTEDLECDPVSFSSSSKDAMWSKDAYDNKIFAFELPAGTCGYAGGAPVAVPAAAPCAEDPTGVKDSDGDGLPDCWELHGIDFNGDGNVDLNLANIVEYDGLTHPPSVSKKDIYVEIDYMAGRQPDAAAIAAVVSAFNNAPGGGINLHVVVDEQLSFNSILALEPCTPPAPASGVDFDAIKSTNFGTAAERAAGVNVLNAKRVAFHYVVWGDTLANGASGCAELPGNDFVVGVGIVYGSDLATRVNYESGAFMHELGHNLGLRHGGGDDINCKPNYLSVMSYSREFDGAPITGRGLDYSRSPLLNVLNEQNPPGLDENVGVGGPVGSQTAFGPGAPTVASAFGPINWNPSSDPVGMPNTNETGLSISLTNIPSVFCPDATLTTLQPFDDWSNLQYNFRASVDYSDGAHITAATVSPELTVQQAMFVNQHFASGYATDHLLYDPAKAFPAGGAVPVRLQVQDARGTNLSASSIAVHPVSLVPASASGPVVPNSGKSNVTGDFRYDAQLAGYIYNVSTKGLAPGSYDLLYTVGTSGDLHVATFILK